MPARSAIRSTLATRTSPERRPRTNRHHSMAATETFPELPLFDLRLEPQDLEAVAETLRSGWLTLGPRTAEFEEAFAAQLGARHAIALSSCTAALHLAYLAAGVGPGDEVIVPSFTFAATAAAAIYCGATPVFAEIVSRREPEPRSRGCGAADHAAHEGRLRRPLRGLRRRGRPPEGALRRARHRADRGRGARPERDARAAASSARGAWRAPSASSPTRCSRSERAACSCTDDDEVAAFVRSRRSHCDDERHLGPPQRAHRHLRRRRPRLQLPPRRAARGAAAVAPGAPRGGNRRAGAS